MDVCFACCKCSRAVSSHTLTAAGVEDHKYIGINKEGATPPVVFMETTPTIQESSAHHHGPAGMPGGGEGKEEESEESEDEGTDEES